MRDVVDGVRTSGNAAQSLDVNETVAQTETAQLSVPDMICGLCIAQIEDALSHLTGVTHARASLSARRVTVQFSPEHTSVPALITALQGIGFDAIELRGDDGNEPQARTHALLPRVGVAGFAAANVMLLSVSVWSGSSTDMDEATRGAFHWLTAMVALPAIAYAGQPFFVSAWRALRAMRLNMDVPISLGVLMAAAMSFVQTIRGTEQVYFDAAVMLLFFLLIGRLLEEQVRSHARGAAENLIGLRPALATVIDAEGAATERSIHDLDVGLRVRVLPGERLPADGRVVSGQTEVDESIISGETIPRYVREGDAVHAGTLNGTATIDLVVTAAADNSLIQEIGRMMETAEQGRGRYVRLADRAARMYAPAVHLLSLTTFFGWIALGSGWETAITNAIAVLIITCPCALALAVPAVQIAASSRLFRRGVIVKVADGLERLADVDTVIFDKTGTLTAGDLTLVGRDEIPVPVLATAAALAAQSRHPYAKAIAREAELRRIAPISIRSLREQPGAGLVAACDAGELRLGSAKWTQADLSQNAQVWLARPGHAPYPFYLTDQLRPDALETITALSGAALPVELLSGDRVDAVARTAREVGIETWRGELSPQDKIARVQALTEAGRKVLMVGDGLNDAPALTAAHASISPATATDITQTAADAVFLGANLEPIVETLATARASRTLAVSNLWIAFGYNLLFVPLAVLGHVTPLLAAIAMSTSSIIVTVNASRLARMSLTLSSATRAKSMRDVKTDTTVRSAALQEAVS